MKPLFSVVIPTFNSREFVEEAVRSALTQTYQNVEVIVDDNASHDGTVELLRDAFGHDPRFKLFANSEDLNIPHGWNRGMRQASGEYVLLLHSDNLLHPRYVETVIVNLEKYDVKVAYSECHYFDGATPPNLFDLNVDKIPHAYLSGGSRAVDYVFRFQRMIPTSSLTIARSCLETRAPFDPGFMWDPDIELMTWLAREFGVLHLQANLAAIRSHGGQAASWKDPTFSIQYQRLLKLANQAGRSEAHHYLVHWAWSNQDVCERLSLIGRAPARTYFGYLARWAKAEIQLLGHFFFYFLRNVKRMGKFTLRWLGLRTSLLSRSS